MGKVHLKGYKMGLRSSFLEDSCGNGAANHFFFIKATSLSDCQQCDFKGNRNRPLFSKISQPSI